MRISQIFKFNPNYKPISFKQKLPGSNNKPHPIPFPYPPRDLFKKVGENVK